MKILIITSCFAPKNIIGAVRISKLAKYLIRLGNEVTIISPVLENYDDIDKSLECNEFDLAKRITVPYSRITTIMTKSHKNQNGRTLVSNLGNQVDYSLKSRMYKFLRGGFVWWRDFEWGVKVKGIVNKDNENYDIVLSSHPNSSTHDVAYYVLKKQKAKKWVADFRDPIVLESSKGFDRLLKIRRQSKIVRHADIVTFVSKSGVEHFVCRNKDKHKVIWLPNGFDEDDFKTINNARKVIVHSSDSLVLSYAGGLYSGERDCSPIFKAISELVSSKKIDIKQIRFDYAGKDGVILKQQAEKYHVESIINDLGQIPRADAINLQAESDCVVVATFCYHDNGGAMTGKIYEPIMMRKPILMVVTGPGKNSEPGNFVKYLDAGYVYEESMSHENVSIIKEALLNMINEKKNGAVVSHIDEARRNEYSYTEIVSKLDTMINNM